MLFNIFKINIFFALFLSFNAHILFADEATNLESQSAATSSSSEANSFVIDEIIVTAEKRTESLQDVSKAVTALGADELETKNIVDFVGLSAIAPVSYTHLRAHET